MVVTLEPAVPEDAAEFVRIQDMAFFEDYKEFGVCPAYGRTKESLRQWILHKPNYKIVADGKIIGKISISDTGNGEGHVDCFCIIPQYQNMGIGQRMMKRMEEEHPYIRTWTLETPHLRKRNIHFYERCGYQVIGRMQEGIWLVILRKQK